MEAVSLWETSSVLVILSLIPAIVWVERRFRLDSKPRSRIVAIHLLSACVFSVVHTSGMVAIRKLVFLLAGQYYDFGNVLVQGFYELQKDLVTYMIILLGVFAVREFRVRRAGELRASALAGGPERSAPSAPDGADRAALPVQRAECDLEPHAGRRGCGGSHDQQPRRSAARRLRHGQSHACAAETGDRMAAPVCRR